MNKLELKEAQKQLEEQDRKTTLSDSDKFVVSKLKGSIVAFSVNFDRVADKISEAISKVFAGDGLLFSGIDMSSFCFKIELTPKEKEKWALFIKLAVSNAMVQLEEEQEDCPQKRGRRKLNELLGIADNHKVCSWFDMIRKKLSSFISNLKEILVCFFCALFDVAYWESRYGKAACFHKMMKAHLKEKIPSLRMFQNAVKWFAEWKRGVYSWANEKREEAEHRIWAKLHQLIKGELVKLMPQPAF